MSGEMRVMALLAVGRGIHRTADVIERGVPNFRMRAAKVALTVAEMLAPITIAGTLSRDDDKPVGHLLAIGTDTLETVETVLNASEKLTLEYAGTTVPVSALFPDAAGPIEDDEDDY